MNDHGTAGDLGWQDDRPSQLSEPAAASVRPVVTWPQYLRYHGGRAARLVAHWSLEMLKSYGFATYPQLTEIMLENEHCKEKPGSTVWPTPPRQT